MDPVPHDQPTSGWSLPPASAWDAQASNLLLFFRPHGTKSRRTWRANVFSIPAGSETAYCLVRSLSYFLELCQAGGDGYVVTKYVLRPLTPSHKTVRNAPLTSNALGNRPQDHLVSAGLYEGEACHSLGRGSLQDTQDKGANREELKAKG